MARSGEPAHGAVFAAPRRRFLAAAGAGLALPGIARAEDAYPSRTVRLILPFAPGGATDLTGRVIMNRLSQRAGQQFIVDNRGGAGGDLAMMAAIGAAPDGYTLVLGGDAWSVRGPILRREMPYDPDTTLAPVARFVIPWTVLVVPAALPVRTFPDFVAYLRTRPEPPSYGSSGPGTLSHVLGELFARALGIDATHVPYRGSSLVLQDLAAGRLQYFFPTAGGLLPVLKGPTLRVLALTSSERQAALLGVPTITELGMPGLAMNTWYGCFTPARTPAPIISRLSDMVGAVLAEPEVVRLLEEQAVVPAFLPTGAFQEFIADQKQRWRQIATQHDLRM